MTRKAMPLAAIRAPTTRRTTSANGAAVKGGRGASTQTIYEALRNDIIEVKIPPGEALDEVGLSQRFRMSRTPVREALIRLEAEGLVKALTNRNTVVAPIEFSTLPPYFDSLTLMYRLTSRLAAQQRTDADLTEIRLHQEAYAQAVDSGDAFAMIAVNRDFHLAIANAGRNPYYVEFFRRLLDEGRRLLRIYYSSYGDKLPRRHVHEEIIDAIAARDEDRADRVAGEHALQVVRQIQSLLNPGISTTIALEFPRQIAAE